MRLLYLLAFAAATVVIVQLVRWVGITIVALIRGPISVCPRCMSKRTRWSRPRLADKIFPAFVLPRRCENCQRRFFSLQSVRYNRRSKSVQSDAHGRSRQSRAFARAGI